ncbi:hypothetical protein A0H81_14096 [Grifola frondosa]|uniref:Uncharacterized protein n=1 Tax=Grifola frondosa TaxID=5627 RepID=A0A1C7LMQ8_GRIFR|nr:hypothetical protein A0H81_14096 [Grifola frondosa]
MVITEFEVFQHWQDASRNMMRPNAPIGGKVEVQRDEIDAPIEQVRERLADIVFDLQEELQRPEFCCPALEG